MIHVSPEIISKALSLLFGEKCPLPADLFSLDESTLRTAYRKRAMVYHPDRAQSIGCDPDKLEESFKRLLGAFRLLTGVVTREIAIEYPVKTQHREARNEPRDAYNQSTSSQQTYRRSYAPADRGFHRGPLPEKPLRFAQYLYYSRIIDWQTMIDAITWQMHVRPKIGEIGRAYSFFDHRGIIDIIRMRNTGERFGDAAFRLGKVTRLQLYSMVGKQMNLNMPIGRYFLDEKLFNRNELSTLLKNNQSYNFRVRQAG